ncbi:uncharacterized protein LOC143837288 isoform X1 [Paroedura picta]|uniref:uncharacterized protein LOC143837288 isoform X1 n=1 Tax=Paroedura picta TaxID=143630 RepID=UPI004056BFF9
MAPKKRQRGVGSSGAGSGGGSDPQPQPTQGGGGARAVRASAKRARDKWTSAIGLGQRADSLTPSAQGRGEAGAGSCGSAGQSRDRRARQGRRGSPSQPRRLSAASSSGGEAQELEPGPMQRGRSRRRRPAPLIPQGPPPQGSFGGGRRRPVQAATSGNSSGRKQRASRQGPQGILDSSSSSEAGAEGRSTTSQEEGSPREGSSSAYWQGYAQAVAQLSSGGARRQRRAGSSPSSSSNSSSGSESSEPPRSRHRKKHRKPGHKRRGNRRSSTSGESSTGDESEEAHRDGRYWLEGAFVPGLPAWLHKRRREAKRLLEADGVLGSRKEPPAKYTDADAPPGIHLPKKLRERALEGYFVDMFAFVRQGKRGGDTGKKRDKKGTEVPKCERSFNNWLRGFAEFMALVVAAYPERGWHLARYLAHVLEAREHAGEEAALVYDQDFRELASYNASARWDLKHHDTWLVKVGPSVRLHKDRDRRSVPGRRSSSLPCWDYNRKSCKRQPCRYSHTCEQCGGGHTALACNKGQQPFRGPRSSGKKDGGPGQSGPSSSTKSA